MKSFCMLFLIVLFSLNCFAQTINQGEHFSAYTIKGTVIDSLSNESVQYATVSIVPVRAPQTPVKVVVTDGKGNFTASLNTTPGNYMINIQFVGMQTKVKRITLSSNQNQLNLGKILMGETSTELQEVVVTAQRPLVKVEIDKLTYSIENDPEAKTSNTLDMLRKVPMITVDSEDNIQLKGSSDFKIYMNGKPSDFLTDNPSDVLKSMPADAIKNVEVITDPGAKYDAEGVGGIINIITTKTSIEGYTVSLRGNASTLGRLGGGAYVSLKMGKIAITGNYNYSYNNTPYADSFSERTYNFSNNEKYLIQNGQSKNKGPFQNGYLEASYEIDKKNLFSISINNFNRKSTSISDYSVTMNDFNNNPYYSYSRNSNSSRTFGSTYLNADYQHTTNRKDELLTVSYRFTNYPNDGNSTTLLENLSGKVPAILSPSQYSINNASSKEHTAQVDYTRPTWKNQKIETGAKYILRKNSSETDNWVNDTLQVSPLNNLQYSQNIYSAYFSYEFQIMKYQFKTGLRGEGTSINVKYPISTTMNFKDHYFNLVPSVTISYMLSDQEQIRLGYSMRIQRPGIRNLNPYVNNTDPQNISYGNPNLSPEKNNNFNLNYSLFTQKINLNASLSYGYVNNGIVSYTFIDSKNKPNVTQTTYGNLGHSQRTAIYLYGKWNASNVFNIFINTGANYVDMNSSATSSTGEQKAHGLNWNASGGMQFSFPLNFRLNLNGGYVAPSIMLQGKMSSTYYTNISLSKDFLKKKLSISLSSVDPFWKTKERSTTTSQTAFYMKNLNYRNARDFRISVTYRFGTMKASAVKKAKKGINNEDIKNNDENQEEENNN